MDHTDSLLFCLSEATSLDISLIISNSVKLSDVEKKKEIQILVFFFLTFSHSQRGREVRFHGSSLI